MTDLSSVDFGELELRALSPAVKPNAIAIIDGSRAEAAVLAARVARRLEPHAVIISSKEDIMGKHSNMLAALALGAALSPAFMDEPAFSTVPNHRPEKSKSKRTGAAQIKRAAKKRRRAK